MANLPNNNLISTNSGTRFIDNSYSSAAPSDGGSSRRKRKRDGSLAENKVSYSPLAPSPARATGTISNALLSPSAPWTNSSFPAPVLTTSTSSSSSSYDRTFSGSLLPPSYESGDSEVLGSEDEVEEKITSSCARSSTEKEEKEKPVTTLQKIRHQISEENNLVTKNRLFVGSATFFRDFALAHIKYIISGTLNKLGGESAFEKTFLDYHCETTSEDWCMAAERFTGETVSLARFQSLRCDDIGNLLDLFGFSEKKKRQLETLYEFLIASHIKLKLMMDKILRSPVREEDKLSKLSGDSDFKSLFSSILEI
jgi:hypothetical protein